MIESATRIKPMRLCGGIGVKRQIKEGGWQSPNWSEGSIVAASQLSSLALDSIPEDASSSNAAAVGDAVVGDCGLVGTPCSSACSPAVSYSSELLHRQHAATVQHCSTQCLCVD